MSTQLPTPTPSGGVLASDSDVLPINPETVTTGTVAADEVTTEQQEKTNEGVARATGVLALGNVGSRVLGLAREVVLSNIFGSSLALEAFNNAIIVSKSFYDLLIAGHVNSAIIPVLSEIAAVKGRDELWRVVSALVSIVTFFISGLVLLLIVAAPAIAPIFSGGDAETQAFTVLLLRLTAPALIFLCLFTVLSGTLYALRSFTLPALAGAVFNGAIVLVTVIFAPLLPDEDSRIMVVAAGWVIGSLIQAVLQWVGLRGAKIRLTLNWRHPALLNIGRLYAPVMFSLVIDTLVIRFFSYNLAARSLVEHGNVYMGWATTLFQFPQGLVGVAISIAILPTLSRQAALVASNEAPAENRRAFKDTLGLGLRLATTLIIPAAVGLFALATPIVQLVFEHGATTPHDTELTVLALRLYLLGLPFAALDLLLMYAFYARQDTLTPALIFVYSLIVYMIAAITLQPTFDLFSLMIADSLKHFTHAVVSAYLLHRALKGLGGQRLLRTFAKTALAACVMGAVATILAVLLPVTGDDLLRETLSVGISGGVSVVVFVAVALALNVEELRWLWGLLKRKLAG